MAESSDDKGGKPKGGSQGGTSQQGTGQQGAGKPSKTGNPSGRTSRAAPPSARGAAGRRTPSPGQLPPASLAGRDESHR